MANFNRIIIIGNLTRDPEYKEQPSGQGLCRLGLASNRQFKNKATGVLSQEVCFVDITVWGPQADSCHKYLQKGRPILVEGRLKFDTWKDADGNTRSKHSITAERVIFLGSRSETSDETFTGGAQKTEAPAAPAAATSTGGAFKEEEPFTDDLPF